MITEKLSVFFIFVTLIPIAYMRHAPLWGSKPFYHDVIRGRHHFRHTQDEQASKSQINTQDNRPDLEFVDVDGNKLDTQGERYQVQDHQNPEIQVVDINGNTVDSPKGQYQVQEQQKSEIQVVGIDGNTVDLQNDQYQVQDQQNPNIQAVDVNGKVANSNSYKYAVQHQDGNDIPVDFGNDYPEVIQVVDVSGHEADVQNDKYEVQDLEYPKKRVVTSIRSTIDHEDKIIPNIKTGNKSSKIEISQFANDSENEVDAPSYKVCKTVECEKLAKEFHKSLNESVDPCQNFYEFACGGWEATNPRPPFSLSWSRFLMVDHTAKLRLKEILAEKIEPSDILPVRQAKKWYRSCMNTERIEERSLELLETHMKAIGGWPLVMNKEDWNENEYTWQTVERYYARLTGSYAFYDIDTDYPRKGHAFGNISIDAPDFSDDNDWRRWLKDDNAVTKAFYRILLNKSTKLFLKKNNISFSKTRLVKESEKLLSFGKAINKLKSANKDDYLTSFAKLIDWYNSNKTHSVLGNPKSGINWSSVIQNQFDLENIKVPPSSDVYIANVNYVRKIGQLLKRTAPRTIVNYIHWYHLGKMAPFTLETLRNVTPNRLLTALLGVEEKEPRWLECINEMKMNDAASYAFVKKYFPQKTKNAAHEMIENVRVALEQNIDGSNWLNRKSKALVKEKLNAMKTFVGFPDWYNNETAIINRYKGVTVGVDYLDNVLSYMRYEMKQNLRRYVTPKAKENPFSGEQEDTPITVNAFYNTETNSAEFPAVDFQWPFFGMNLPNNVNYGIIGLLIGHEMGHAFDNCGITHDKTGRKTQLTEMVLRSYYERVNCFVDQFDEYHGTTKVANRTQFNCDENEDDDDNDDDDDDDEKKKKTYGQKTVGENIADTTGLQAVFKAYKTLSKKKNSDGEMRLPGLEEFTDDQLFFLSFAEMWCEVKTPGYSMLEGKGKDPHSSTELRVIGALSNTKDFARAFNCPIGSRMNPTNKCSIWNKPGVKKERSFRRKNHRSRHIQWNG